jgi:hypothetical protein
VNPHSRVKLFFRTFSAACHRGDGPSIQSVQTAERGVYSNPNSVSNPPSDIFQWPLARKHLAAEVSA